MSIYYRLIQLATWRNRRLHTWLVDVACADSRWDNRAVMR